MYKKGVIVGPFDFVTRTHEDLFFYAAERCQEVVMCVVASYDDIPDLGMRMQLVRKTFPTLNHCFSVTPITEAQFEPPDTPESRLSQYGRYLRTYRERPRNIMNGVGCLFTTEEDDILIAKGMRVDCHVMTDVRGGVSNHLIREEIFRAGSLPAMQKYHHLLHPETVKLYGSADITNTRRTYVYAGTEDDYY